MVSLPFNPKLPIHYLAASFDNVTNSYKFFWFLAILDHIRENQSRTISINDLIARMLASIWYPTNYFRLSFGKQDRLGQIALQIGEHTSLSMDAKRHQVINVVQQSVVQSYVLAEEVKSLAKYVPYRFLRPFFTQQLRGLKDCAVNGNIEQLAFDTFNDPECPCMYRFITLPYTGIEIQNEWFDYLNQHLRILMGFCHWNLVIYLQKNNPNIPNIANKLLEPEKRDLKRAHAFWSLVFDDLGELKCIYSGQNINKNDHSLDHFLPWRFTTHDLLWNIIPTPKNVNSAKNDNLPNMTHYFTSFAKLQFQAMQIVALTPKTNLLEDHVLLLKVGSIEEIQRLTFENFHEVLHAAIVPQIQIATNMGFSNEWSY